MQVEIAASEHVNFLKNQMTWRIVERVDGDYFAVMGLALGKLVALCRELGLRYDFGALAADE